MKNASVAENAWATANSIHSNLRKKMEKREPSSKTQIIASCYAQAAIKYVLQAPSRTLPKKKQVK
jgi:hypothetical protein